MIRGRFKTYHHRAVEAATYYLRVAGVREPSDDAKDAVGQAWEDVLHMGIEDEELFRKTLFRCVRFRAIGTLRRVITRANYAASVEQKWYRGAVNPGWGADANEVVRAACIIMTPETFYTWFLKDILKWSQKEVCDELNLSFTAMNSRVARARDLLKAEFSHDLVVPTSKS